MEVPRIQCLAGRRADGLSPELAIFPPGEIEVPTLAAGRFTMNEDESRIGLSILLNHPDELPALANSAILYKVYQL